MQNQSMTDDQSKVDRLLKILIFFTILKTHVAVHLKFDFIKKYRYKLQ